MDKMNMTLLKDRGPYVHGPMDKTDFGEILVPDDVDTKHVFTLKRAGQPTVPLDSKTHREEEEEKSADTKYVDTDPDKSQMPQVIDRRGDMDNAEMLANDDYQQTMYETANQEEDDNKSYPEKPAAPYTAS
jgi:hypothetical protein